MRAEVEIIPGHAPVSLQDVLASKFSSQCGASDRERWAIPADIGATGMARCVLGKYATSGYAHWM